MGPCRAGVCGACLLTGTGRMSRACSWASELPWRQILRGGRPSGRVSERYYCRLMSGKYEVGLGAVYRLKVPPSSTPARQWSPRSGSLRRRAHQQRKKKRSRERLRHPDPSARRSGHLLSGWRRSSAVDDACHGSWS